MSHAFEHLFASGFANLILIGSDLPALPVRFFHQAYAWLEKSADVVLGPSADGGYYLIAMSRLITAIFDDIGWSSADVLSQTLHKLDDLSLKHELLSEWHDIDTVRDLARLQSQAKCREVAMKNTFALLNELRQRGRL